MWYLFYALPAFGESSIASRNTHHDKRYDVCTLFNNSHPKSPYFGSGRLLE
ncbi:MULTISPECIES: hypothetical protein [unclassified Chryseobacterium]|uniref:hypothetical protein n=1 Tax=unclassified Chryseobacterium TaxID=2593645 RepID=UPI00300FD097